MTIKISVAQVQELREKRQCSLAEAKSILVGRELNSMLDRTSANPVLKEILETLINKVYPQ